MSTNNDSAISTNDNIEEEPDLFHGGIIEMDDAGPLVQGLEGEDTKGLQEGISDLLGDADEDGDGIPDWLQVCAVGHVMYMNIYLQPVRQSRPVVMSISWMHGKVTQFTDAKTVKPIFARPTHVS